MQAIDIYRKKQAPDQVHSSIYSTRRPNGSPKTNSPNHLHFREMAAAVSPQKVSSFHKNQRTYEKIAIFGVSAACAIAIGVAFGGVAIHIALFVKWVAVTTSIVFSIALSLLEPFLDPVTPPYYEESIEDTLKLQKLQSNYRKEMEEFDKDTWPTLSDTREDTNEEGTDFDTLVTKLNQLHQDFLHEAGKTDLEISQQDAVIDCALSGLESKVAGNLAILSEKPKVTLSS